MVNNCNYNIIKSPHFSLVNHQVSRIRIDFWKFFHLFFLELLLSVGVYCIILLFTLDLGSKVMSQKLGKRKKKKELIVWVTSFHIIPRFYWHETFFFSYLDCSILSAFGRCNKIFWIYQLTVLEKSNFNIKTQP